MRCPRCLNERADLLSHAADLERHSDFFLPLPLRQTLQHHWRLRFTLDLFATRRSARLPRYVTRFYDPLAVFHDAFPRSFVGYTPHTALSPLSSILPLLHAYAGSSSCHSGPSTVVFSPPRPNGIAFSYALTPRRPTLPLGPRRPTLPPHPSATPKTPFDSLQTRHPPLPCRRVPYGHFSSTFAQLDRLHTETPASRRSTHFSSTFAQLDRLHTDTPASRRSTTHSALAVWFSLASSSTLTSGAAVVRRYSPRPSHPDASPLLTR